MDKIDKIDHYIEIDSDSNTTIEGEKTLLDVLRTEPDIIAYIFRHLKLADQLNLGMTCKEMEKIHNSRLQFWQKIWLNLGNAVSSSSNPELTRRYVNIKYHVGKHQAEQSPSEKLAPIASSIKAIEFVYYHGSYGAKKIENSSEHFVGMLPLFEKLEHLKLGAGSAVLRKFEQYMKTESAPTTAVNMKNLRSLTINIELFAILHGCIDFSSLTQLKSVNITDASKDKLVGDELQSAQRKLMDLIMQQKGLDKLELLFPGCSFIFDRPFMLEFKLQEFEIFDESYHQISFNRQDNLVGFLHSQKPELSSPKFYMSGAKSPRMFAYLASIFDLPITIQEFTVGSEDSDVDDDSEDHNEESMEISNHPDGRYFTSRELSQICQSSAEPNESTVNLIVTVNVKEYYDDWLQFIRLKFPNMQILEMKCDKIWYWNIENGNLPSLIPLQSLSHLKCLKIKTDNICTAFHNVSLSTLTDFEFTCIHRDINDFIELENVQELQKFIGRHKKLTNLNIELQNLLASERGQSFRTQYAKETSKLLGYALENLRELKTMEFAAVEYPCDLSIVNETRKLMKNHVNFGFTIKLKFEYDDFGVILTKTANGVTEKKYKTRGR